ncbi:ribonuclease H-like domain-containing protein [Tanacetum coccineum]
MITVNIARTGQHLLWAVSPVRLSGGRSAYQWAAHSGRRLPFLSVVERLNLKNKKKTKDETGKMKQTLMMILRNFHRYAQTILLEVIPKMGNGHVSNHHRLRKSNQDSASKTAEEYLAREMRKKERTILLCLYQKRLHKAMTGFKSLSHLEIHCERLPPEDANHKFLRSLPSAGLNCPQLDHEDLEQLDEYDLEEMDLKWQVAMISMRMKKFYKKTGRKLQFDAKEPVGFDKTKVECYNCHKTGHFARECRTKGNQDSRRRDAWNSGNKDGRRSGKQEDSKALVTIDGEGVDWTSHSEEEEDYALMACNSSGSDTEVTSCSNECKESYAKLKKLYDAQREQLSDASIEIKAYTQGLKKVEAQLVAHQQGQLWYEEKIRFMKIDLDDKTDVLIYHKKLLAEAQKEKEDLKA